MLFPTFDFAIFFAIAFTVNWLLNPYSVAMEVVDARVELRVLRLGGMGLVPAALGTTTIAFIGGVAVVHTTTEKSRRVAMALSCGGLLGLLGWFKYYGFVSVNLDNLTHALGRAGPSPCCRSRCRSPSRSTRSWR